MATVNVIIPLYNKQTTIERAIRSVLSQTWTDWRLIIVDDGSTDAGIEIVRRLQKEDRRIELIQQANAPVQPATRGFARQTLLMSPFLTPMTSGIHGTWRPPCLPFKTTLPQWSVQCIMNGLSRST
jgi:cellulose synthase/poly-beta-1,6-N-acetylglucosamine synthase-like glycosyltransferase